MTRSNRNFDVSKKADEFAKEYLLEKKSGEIAEKEKKENPIEGNANKLSTKNVSFVGDKHHGVQGVKSNKMGEHANF